jgi:type VI secretion system secreted protein Hcp
MAVDAFLKIDKVQGESTDSNHQGWIEILSYHHGITQPASSTASSTGGASAERVNFGDFSITKLVDMASPKIFEAGCTGRHIPEVIVEVCRAGGDKQKYLVIKMQQVLITSYVHDGGSDFPVEGVSFNPGKFTMEYIRQSRVDGTPGGSVMAGWDLIANKTTA